MQKPKEKEEKITVSNSKRSLKPDIGNSNKKDKKAYNNFIQNIKRANKNRKKNSKNLGDDPKLKLAKAANKMNLLNKAFVNVYKNINEEEKEKEKEKQEINQKKEEEESIKPRVSLSNKNDNNINDNNYIDELKKGYTGFVLLKQTEGANIFQIKLEGTLEEINKIFKTHKIEIEGEQVELIHTKELEKLRSKCEREENNNDNVVVKEGKEDPLLAAVRKKALETDNMKIEEDNIKIKEMKERIQKYKNELRKGENDDYNNFINIRMSYQIKNNFSSDRNKRINDNQELNNINNQQREAYDINNIPSKFKLKEGQDKKQLDTINENEIKIEKIKIEEKDKERERDKSMSRAMDRFKKRYKKDNSAELRTKKSEKINEIAKRLENVIGRSNVSAEIKYENELSNEIQHPEKEQENNFEELLENKPVISKKSKKIQKFEL